LVSDLRLLADDLTGALDSAARFVPVAGPIPVHWDPTEHAGPAAFDTGTRDLPADSAGTRVQAFAPLLRDGVPAFKKIDSLLRGHVAAELAACMRQFDHCVLAPAFPFQGRVTRRGRQLVRDGAGWRDTGVDLPAQLRRLGLGIDLLDAETDADLGRIVAAGGRLPGRVLWCGTGGLAGALAGSRRVPSPTLPPPVLALVGSDHPVSRAQIAAVPPAHAAGLVTCELPDGTSRAEARGRIAAAFAALLSRIERPGTLFVTGGETLRDLCIALGVEHLLVDGEIEPGVPTSVMRGGAWDGQRLVSKSGAFGDTEFLARLLRNAR
jgi:uncharacterized protein YgbK (DUF1537 family)